MDAFVEQVWSDYRAEGSPEARDRLVLQYAPLVKFFAGRAPGDPVTAAEQGLETLTAAIETYDGTNGGFEAHALGMLSELCPDPYSWDQGWS